MRDRTILSLCDGTGAWSKPYVEAGYNVIRVTLPDLDVRTFVPPSRVHGVLAAPPCTEFAVSGARWWAGKDPALLAEALAVFDACMSIIRDARPTWWAIENPVGRLRKLRSLGAPRLTFDPCDYAGFADDPEAERYTKRTQVWGSFNDPSRCRLEPRGARPGQPNDWYSRVGGKSAATKEYRSRTPEGFARAFYSSNP